MFKKKALLSELYENCLEKSHEIQRKEEKQSE